MTAYVAAPLYDSEATDAAVAELPFDVEVKYSSEFVPGQDWNSEWERHYFKPIIVGGKVAVHSSFHTDVPEAQYDIVIDPVWLSAPATPCHHHAYDAVYPRA